ncbi:hypothetical protein TOPH_08025 [Tolypocladium ophioglossoides CBS 100239]|uniref:Uncharacterized protein n=1 Tax=Tolypocladium ophioglossoides (strain CBS 100239) TaxID=1163406 RepID=A0A0L0MZQ7_TOLOC|nr:hypothetical protein TOPH_08025 [Tolypocladium ophioglossoides CBS 100239]
MYSRERTPRVRRWSPNNQQHCSHRQANGFACNPDKLCNVPQRRVADRQNGIISHTEQARYHHRCRSYESRGLRYIAIELFCSDDLPLQAAATTVSVVNGAGTQPHGIGRRHIVSEPFRKAEDGGLICPNTVAFKFVVDKITPVYRRQQCNADSFRPDFPEKSEPPSY